MNQNQGWGSFPCLNIIKTFSLYTQACTFRFRVIDAHKENKSVDVRVDIKAHKNYADYLPKKFNCRLYLQDFKNLVHYFQNHMQKLLTNNFKHPSVYMPVERDFSIRALGGTIYSEEDGFYSILLMINCGKISAETANNYFGFESVADVRHISLFCSELEAIIAGHF